MVTHLNGSHNGITGNGHTLVCPSDYEPRPVIDVTPKHLPSWRDELAPYTHTLQWLDSDGHSHSMTLRSNSLRDLMDDLKLLKQMIRQAKEQHSIANPEAKLEQYQDSDTQHCHIHGIDMPRRWSKRTNGHYFGHKCIDGTFCYGKAKA